MVGKSSDRFRCEVIQSLEADQMEAIERYEAFDTGSLDHYEFVELTHEYLDLLAFKLRESKSKMDKNRIARYIFEFISRTLKKYDFNQKFVASQGKTLVTYYKNTKDLNAAIEVLEFLILHGITENSGPGFHLQLDELYRLRKKRESRAARAQSG